jgi:isocitrate dehydrogenase kinase/phosphatase
MTKAERKIVPERHRDALQAGAAPLPFAHTILDGFNTHYRTFRYVSQQAKAHFENGDWQWLQDAVRDRIAFYDRYVMQAVERLRAEYNVGQLQNTDWAQIKQQYTALLIDH